MVRGGADALHPRCGTVISVGGGQPPEVEQYKVRKMREREHEFGLTLSMSLRNKIGSAARAEGISAAEWIRRAAVLQLAVSAKAGEMP